MGLIKSLIVFILSVVFGGVVINEKCTSSNDYIKSNLASVFSVGFFL